MSTSPSQIIFCNSLYAQPTNLKQISFTDVTENQREILILKSTLLHTNSNAPPACSHSKGCKMWVTLVKSKLYCEVFALLEIFSLSSYRAFLFYILFVFVFHKYA